MKLPFELRYNYDVDFYLNFFVSSHYTHVLVHCEGFYMYLVIKTIKQIVRWYISFDKYYAFRRIWSQSSAWLTYGILMNELEKLALEFDWTLCFLWNIRGQKIEAYLGLIKLIPTCEDQRVFLYFESWNIRGKKVHMNWNSWFVRHGIFHGLPRN